jgi:hypothetical protein
MTISFSTKTAAIAAANSRGGDERIATDGGRRRELVDPRFGFEGISDRGRDPRLRPTSST